MPWSGWNRWIHQEASQLKNMYSHSWQPRVCTVTEKCYDQYIVFNVIQAHETGDCNPDLYGYQGNFSVDWVPSFPQIRCLINHSRPKKVWSQLVLLQSFYSSLLSTHFTSFPLLFCTWRDLTVIIFQWGGTLLQHILIKITNIKRLMQVTNDIKL